MTESPELDTAAMESLVGRLADEFIDRLERGERPDVEEYAVRHPEAAGVIRQVLAAVGLVRSAAASANTCHRATPESPLDGCLGDFRIIRQVGQGGMGVVYEAEQISLRRRVALKVLPFASALDPRRLQRFKNEAHAAAQLHHTHIVPVYGVGCECGVHFYAMQFIDGCSLDRVITDLRRRDERTDDLTGDGSSPTSSYLGSAGSDTPVDALVSTWHSARKPTDVQTVVRLALQAAEALDHAHQMGVIHRDVKPANLLIDSQGDLWVTDFGLAQVQADTRMTATGDRLGTLRYMSPEQALGKPGLVDHRTDVYSLGATLYELLALEPAFSATDAKELLRQVGFEEPVPPRKRNRFIPVDLETVILKAMAKSIDERYATAQELADDLRRFLEDRPIRARPPTLLQRLRKWYRRHQTVVNWTTVVAAVGLILSVAILFVQNVRIDRQRAAAEVTANDRRIELYWRNIALAELELSSRVPRVALAEKYLNDCPADLRGWEWHCLKRKRYGTLTVRPHPPGATDAPIDMTFSPDSRWIAVVSVIDRRVLILDAETGGETRRPFERPAGGAARVRFSPSGRFLAVQSSTSGANRGTVSVWDLRNDLQPLQRQVDCTVNESAPAFAFDATDRLAVLDASTKAVQFLDAMTGRVLRALAAPGGLAGSVVFSPDSRLIAAADREGNVYIWDADSGVTVAHLTGNKGPVHALAFSPDGQMVASASAGGLIGVWDVPTGKKVHLFHGGGIAKGHLLFSPDGRFLVANTGAYHLGVWDVTTGNQVSSPQGDGPCFNLKDGRLAVGGRNVTLLDLEEGREVLTLHEHSAPVFSASFSPNGRRLASVSMDGAVRIWDATPLEDRPGPEVRTIPLGAAVGWAAWSRDGKRLATTSRGGPILIWDAATGTESSRIPHPGATRLVYSPEGRQLVAGDADGRVIVWDATGEGDPLFLRGHSSFVVTVAWSPDGKQIASATMDEVEVCDAATGALLFTLEDGDARAALASIAGSTTSILAQPARARWAVAFSPDGKYIASAVPVLGDASRSRVTIWDRTGKVVARLQEHPLAVVSVAFSPNSRHVASGSFGSTIRIGDVNSHNIRLLDGHAEAVFALAFSPDGDYLVSGSHDGTVKVWNWQQIPLASPNQIAAALGLPVPHAPSGPGPCPEPVTIRGHLGRIWGVEFSPDGRYLATAGGYPDEQGARNNNPEMGEVKIWDQTLWNKPAHRRP